jgi:hypothetical protein
MIINQRLDQKYMQIKNNQTKHYQLTFVSLITVGLFSLNFCQATQAQTNKKNPFNQQQCINKLVKEGLAKNQADIWCNYENECLDRAQKEGLPPYAAQSLCDCTIKQFRKTYTAEKFKELNQQAKTNQEIANKLREVGESCFEDLLFED